MKKSDLLLAFLSAIVSKIVADEAKEWMPLLGTVLIRWAARRLQPNFRDRYEEEWLAHSDDLPGSFAKLCFGLGCVVTAIRVTGVTGVLGKIAFNILILPFIEVATPISAVLFVLSTWAPGYERPSFRRRPEAFRANRLQKAAGGLVVLGLNELDPISADYHAARKESLRAKRFRERLAGSMFESAMLRSAERYRWLVVKFRAPDPAK
jgi:hypothetical protein